MLPKTLPMLGLKFKFEVEVALEATSCLAVNRGIVEEGERLRIGKMDEKEDGGTSLELPQLFVVALSVMGFTR